MERFALAAESPSVAAHAAAPAASGSAGVAALALAKANACMSCHGVDHKIVGPAFRDVAKKYSGRPDEVAYLAGKIKKGGEGAWGPIAMPEQPQLKEADAKAIAEWLASGAKQ